MDNLSRTPRQASAILITFTSGWINEEEAVARANRAFSNVGQNVKVFHYNLDDPEEFVSHSGRWMRFLTRKLDRETANKQDGEEPRETFRKIISKELKPLLREMWHGRPKEEKPSASA